MSELRRGALLLAADAEIGCPRAAGEERDEIDDALAATLDGPELAAQPCPFGVRDGKRVAARLARLLEDVDDAPDVALQVLVRLSVSGDGRITRASGQDCSAKNQLAMQHLQRAQAESSAGTPGGILRAIVA